MAMHETEVDSPCDDKFDLEIGQHEEEKRKSDSDDLTIHSERVCTTSKKEEECEDEKSERFVGDIEKAEESSPESETIDGERDEFLVEWEGEDDPQNPLNWSGLRKWIMASIGIGFCFVVSMSVSAYAIGQESLKRELNVGNELAALGITTFTISFGSASLILAPLSEVYGRNPLYVLSALVFALMFIPQALAQNIEAVLISRFFAGCGGSTAISLVAGTLSDLFPSHKRGLPMAIFSYSAFVATSLGPTFFGYLEKKHDHRGFRLISWIMFGISGLFFVSLCGALIGRETRASVLLARKASRIRKETGDSRYHSRSEDERLSLRVLLTLSLTRPVRLLFTEIVLAVFALYLAWAWSCLYIILESFGMVLAKVYDFDALETGLAFLSQTVGVSIGFVANMYSDKLYLRYREKHGPEARLYFSMASGVLVAGGIFFYTFTLDPSIKPEVSMVGIAILYAGLYGIYVSVFNYVSDSYTLYASSALSGVNAARNIIGAFAPLFTNQLYSGLGIRGAGSLIGGLAALLACTPFLLFRYGALLRARSPFAAQTTTGKPGIKR